MSILSGIGSGMFGAALGGLSGGGFNGVGSFLDSAKNNPNAALASDLAGGFLGELGTFDPMEVAQSQFDLMSPMLQSAFEDRRLGLEGRQFNQGRLGSTGGAQEMEGLFNSENDAIRQLLFDSYGQGMQGQQHLFNMGSGLATLDPQIRGMFGNLWTGTRTPQGTSPIQSLGAGMVNSGVGSITKGVNGLFNNPASVGNYGGFGTAYDPNHSFGGGR